MGTWSIITLSTRVTTLLALWFQFPSLVLFSSPITPKLCSISRFYFHKNLLFPYYVYIPHMQDIILYLPLFFCLTLLNMIASKSIYIEANCMILFLYSSSFPLCTIASLSSHLFWTLKLFPDMDHY